MEGAAMGPDLGASRDSRRGHLLRGVVAAVAATLVLATIVPVAFGTVGFRERIHDEYSFSHEDCGWTVNVDGEFNGDFFVRVGKGEFETAFYGHNNFDWTETHVRESDGATIVLSANLLFQETKAAHVEGTIYTFTSVTAGQFIVIRDASGKIIGRDRGNITETLTFDTLGDDTPGGAFIEQVSIRFNGQYPSEFIDYCALFDA
jgi:hypothetical protein